MVTDEKSAEVTTSVVFSVVVVDADEGVASRASNHGGRGLLVVPECPMFDDCFCAFGR